MKLGNIETTKVKYTAKFGYNDITNRYEEMFTLKDIPYYVAMNAVQNMLNQGMDVRFTVDMLDPYNPEVSVWVD